MREKKGNIKENEKKKKGKKKSQMLNAAVIESSSVSQHIQRTMSGLPLCIVHSEQ